MIGSNVWTNSTFQEAYQKPWPRVVSGVRKRFSRKFPLPVGAVKPKVAMMSGSQLHPSLLWIRPGEAGVQVSPMPPVL